MMDSTMNSSIVSSPLKRKSVLQESTRLSSLFENDDEAERLARRHRISINSIPQNASPASDRRRSLGSCLSVNMPVTQMAECISQCIKLSTENKINLKNAFSLEMIDFMTYMIKKKDANMSNLQVASTSLDVSTKIYGFRVDGVHMEILKMVSVQEKDKGQSKNAETVNAEKENMDSQTEKSGKKNKRKNKQQILSTINALRTNVQIEKPSLIKMEADSLSSDTLYQAVLPNHANSGFCQHLYNDILVDTIECKNVRDDEEYSISSVVEFSEMDICPPLAYFNFQSWTADDDLEELPLENSVNENNFQFDLDASITHDNEPVPNSINYFDIEERELENIDKCTRIPRQVENIVDFREVLTNTTKTNVSEYSFIEKNLNIHWAGPSHWKVTNFRKTVSKSGLIETCRQASNKQKKEVELCYDDEAIKGINTKFQPNQMIKILYRTLKLEWREDVLLLPPDEHYDILRTNKLYLHKTMFKQPDNSDLVVTELSNGTDNYNYDNDNDISNYCPDNDDNTNNVENNRNDNGIRSEEDDVIGGSTTAFTGDNLVEIPKLTAKSTVAYSVRAKKIDMRQLKKSIWQCLIANDKENCMDVDTTQQDSNNKIINNKYFNEIYKKLPTVLTKTNAEALSLPISFVSLLHLANEKTLKITTPIDMSDIIVQPD